MSQGKEAMDKSIVKQVAGSMALSGLNLTEEDKKRILRLLDCLEEVEAMLQELIEKHRKRNTVRGSAKLRLKWSCLAIRPGTATTKQLVFMLDANTPHEALSAALYELLGALQQQGHKLPGFGVRQHTSTPSAAGLTEEQKKEIRKQRKAEQEQRERELWEAFDSHHAAAPK